VNTARDDLVDAAKRLQADAFEIRHLAECRPPDEDDAAQSDTRPRSDERPSKREGCCRRHKRLASSRKHGARK
jgi:hypothetical protein